MDFDYTPVSKFLEPEQLDTCLFRGLTPKPSYPRIFGGQVLAQAMNAATRTIDLSRTIHSLHGYFLRPGNPEKTIIYDVDRIRDGGSFTTRRVIAKQSGNAIYSCELSFMLPSAGVAHQENMPTLWSEDDINQLESETQFNARMQTTYPNKFKPEPNIFTEWDIRRIHRVDPFSPEPSPPLKEYWLKYNTPLPIKSENNSSTDYFLQHQTLLAYISDMGLMGSAFLPHQITYYTNTVQAASLDHVMWFHQPCNINEWIYYRCESPWAGAGRGLSFGRLYSQKGLLLASTAQEGLMRPFRKQ